MIFKKIKKLGKKAFSSKTYLLLGLNKFVPEDFGKIIDIAVDREDKNIFVSLEKESKKGSLSILKYAVVYEGTQAFLSFDTIEKDGYLKSLFKQAKIDKKIKIDPKYIKAVRRMI